MVGYLVYVGLTHFYMTLAFADNGNIVSPKGFAIIAQQAVSQLLD